MISWCKQNCQNVVYLWDFAQISIIGSCRSEFSACTINGLMTTILALAPFFYFETVTYRFFTLLLLLLRSFCATVTHSVSPPEIYLLSKSGVSVEELAVRSKLFCVAKFPALSGSF